MTEADFHLMCKERGLSYMATHDKDLKPYVQVINWVEFTRSYDPSFTNVKTFLLGKISKAELFEMTEADVEEFLLSCTIDHTFS